MRGEGPIRRLAYRRRKWPVTLAIGAIFRDEAPYLDEWVTFHRGQGVERFYLYDNESADAPESALAAHCDVVTVIPWPGELQQLAAYADCIRRHRFDTRWLALIDIDEFLFSPRAESLPKVLEQFDRVAGVAVNWRCYGPSGHAEPQTSTLDAYTRRAPDEHPMNEHVKSVVVPMLTADEMGTPHHFRHFDRCVGENGDPVVSPWRVPATADVLRINHYVTRSRAEHERKQKTPRSDRAVPRPVLDLDELDAVEDPILSSHGRMGRNPVLYSARGRE